MVVHVCNPNTQKAEARNVEFKVSLGYSETLIRRKAVVTIFVFGGREQISQNITSYSMHNGRLLWSL